MMADLDMSGGGQAGGRVVRQSGLCPWEGLEPIMLC